MYKMPRWNITIISVKKNTCSMVLTSRDELLASKHLMDIVNSFLVRICPVKKKILHYLVTLPLKEK